MADAVAEVKARLDIVEVIGGYVRLQRSGRDHKGLCPFHAERTPSFGVSQEKQVWYCFGCSEVTSSPKTFSVPGDTCSDVLSARMSVDLPAPDGPMIATRSPRAMDNETADRATAATA